MWHSLAAVATHVTGDVVTATNACILVTAAVIWPLSLIALVRALVVATPLVYLATGVLAASVPAFPLLMIDWGVLYPYSLGLSVVPAILASAVVALRAGSGIGDDRLRVGFAGILMLPGALVAHPSVAPLVLWIISPAAVSALVRMWRSRAAQSWTGRRKAVIVTAQVASVLGAIFVWARLRPDYNAWPPIETKMRAARDVLLVAPMGGPATLTMAILAAGGLLSVWRQPRIRWFVGSWLVVAGLWVVVAAWGVGPFRTALTSTWYSDPPRVAAGAGVLACVLSVLCVNRLLGYLEQVAIRKHMKLQRAHAAFGVVLVAATQFSPAMAAGLNSARGSYEFADPACPPGDRTCLVTADERALLARLPKQIRPGQSCSRSQPTVAPWLTHFTESRLRGPTSVNRRGVRC